MIVTKKVNCPRLSCTRCRRYVVKLTSCNLKPVITCAALCVFTFAVSLYLLLFQIRQQGLKGRPRIKGTPMSHVSLKLLEQALANITNATTSQQDAFDAYETVFQLYTSGCQIPLSVLNFKEYELNKTKYATPGTCGKRAVFLRKTLHAGTKVKISIYKPLFNMSEIDESYGCCYRYIKSNTKGKRYKIQYTPCINIRNADVITLKYDFINVKCIKTNRNNVSTTMYQDFYAFANKLETKKPKGKEKFNVLMLGIDSLSMSHFAQSLPRSYDFVREHFWLRYPGFHKIADNKLQNLVAILTGSNFTTFNQTCFRKIDTCNNHFIWSRFKEAGYVTAYGEDHLQIGETFSDSFRFHGQPTHHYAKPLFYAHERTIYDKGLVCSGKIPSAQLLLDYALDFANTYKNDSFFGLFWINSFSNQLNKLNNADKILENFLNSLSYTGVLKNTFVIIFSSHGLRFGDLRIKVEGYYDDRLPLLYVWTPWKFRIAHAKELKYAALNQMSLITSYDLYNTLVGIQLWSSNMTTANYSTTCKHCVSIFEPIHWTRTCEDVTLDQKWCSCHNLYALDIQDSEGIKSVFFAVAYINSKAATVQTRNCWNCAKLFLSKVLRIHFHYVNTVLYYVVAFSTAPANMTFEAVISKNGKKLSMIGEVSLISPRWGNNPCTLKQSDHLFCPCQLLDDCQNSSF